MFWQVNDLYQCRGQLNMLNTIPELYWLDFDLYDICMYVCRQGGLLYQQMCRSAPVKLMFSVCFCVLKVFFKKIIYFILFFIKFFYVLNHFDALI